MGTMVLFSAVQGKVLDRGKPVAGARIERKYKWGWNSQMGTDSTTTDASGEFTVPMIERRSLLGSLLPHEPWIDQTVLIHHDSKTYEAWVSVKRDYDNGSEVRGRPFVLTCRLEATPTQGEFAYGICDVS